MPTPPPGATISTFQVGTYNSLTDSFTLVVDLNDFSSTFVHWNSIKITPPDEIDVRGNNMRTPGERISRIQYKNGHITVAVMVRAATPQAVTNKIRQIRQAIRNENLPYCIRFAFPGAAAYTYFDVSKCSWTPPYDPQQFNAGFQSNVVMDFECQPGMRGDRLTLQNYVVNPGFEGPCGGANAPAPQVFNDPFATVNAYAVQTGGAPTLNPANTYIDVFMANLTGTLSRYYRLGEGSGTNAADIGGSVQTGTYTGSPTLGVAGAISGDTDTAVTLNGTSQYVSVPVTGLPTGNAAISIGCWVKFSANPASTQVPIAYGGSGNHNFFQIDINASGDAVADVGAGTVTSGALTTGTYHFVVATWDGTTLRLYVDGASVGTPATPGAQTIPTSSTTCHIGANALASPAQFFGGQVDEAFVVAGTLTAGQITNIYNAGHTGATGTVASAMSLPAAARVAFGSPAWGAMQTWQVRFRWNSAASEYDFYLHFTDSNNNLFVSVKPAQLLLAQRVAGTLNILASPALAPALTHEAWYWLQVTQFPAPSGNQPYIQATLLSDNEGAVGAQVAQLAAATSDAVTALSGRPQIGAVGAALVLGGAFSNVHSVSLFGPGGWSFNPNYNAATAQGSGAWEGDLTRGASGTPGNCIPIGTSSLVPVTSLGAARVDFPPAGTATQYWANYAGGAPAGTAAIPVPSAGDTLGVSVWTMSNGLGSQGHIFASIYEYSSNGTLLRSGNVGATLTGNQGSWTQISGTYATGASCAYVGLRLQAYDISAPGASANAIVWFENCQVWDETTTGQTSMPYCELRFMVSPAQLVVSGLLGDMPAGAHLSLGTYLPASSVSTNTNLQMVLGQRAQPTTQGVLYGKYNMGPTLDSANSLSGWYGFIASATAVSLAPDAFNALNSITNSTGQTEANVVGVYHFFARVFSGESAGNLSKITLQTLIDESNITLGAAPVAGPLLSPLSTSSLWNIVDLGQVALPAVPAGNLRDLTQISVDTFANWNDSGAGARIQADWWVLVPVDASLILATIGFNGSVNNPHNFGTGWMWTYFDGLARQQSKSASASLGTGSGSAFTGTPIPTPANAIGGTSGANSLSLSSSASPYLTLDPTQQVNGVSGINELAGFVGDTNQGAWPTLPLFAEIVYSPLYNYPR